MQNKVLELESSGRIKVYLAWVPRFRGMERDVPKATGTMADARVSHYWDGDSQLVKGYTRTLGLPEDAWDIFLLYGPDARWDGADPPAPEYWMHQLGSARNPRVAGPYLDAAVFLQKTRELLSRAMP